MRHLGWMILLVGLLISGCARGNAEPQATTNGPVVQITAPPSGARIPTGREVEIQSTATDPAGVERIELYVDGVLIRIDTPPAAEGQSAFSVVQRWVPSQPGPVQVEVRAYNVQGQAGIPVGITLEAEGAGLAPTATPTPRSLEINPTPPPTEGTDPTPPPAEGIPGTVEAAAGLNVRQGPALDAERIDGLNPGAPVTAIARDATGEWTKVRYGSDNREGWIYAPYVTWDGDPSTLPISSQ